jgi:hypothetical protein
VLVCYVRERDVVFARVPKPDQKRILETIVSELVGESRPRGVCSRILDGWLCCRGGDMRCLAE